MELNQWKNQDGKKGNILDLWNMMASKKAKWIRDWQGD